nr:aldehyde dehydrogenase [uncultured Flavobacterium sp.]
MTSIFNEQKIFFNSGVTLSFQARKQKLLTLLQAIEQNEEAILAALYADFKKSEFEGFMTEIGMVYLDLKNHIKNLKSWMKPKSVRASVLNFPSKDYVQAHPFGQVLIISPWNYPFLLAIHPLISAIAAGNVVVLKPSELTTNTAAVLKKIIESVFDKNWVAVIEGDVEVTTQILKHRFDMIFFTGSTAVGKIVHQAAAKHLTPVVLELGGKSPCIVTASANLEVAVNRIVFGKFVNAGQTCIAPDFIWIHESVKSKFLELLHKRIVACYGTDIKNSPDFPRIINLKNYNRLVSYLNSGDKFFGGTVNEDDLYIEPTILNNVTFDDAVMQEEIFGPILPILTYNNLDEVIKHNQESEKPLAFYIFSGDSKEIQYLQSKTQFGGACINDVLSHIVNKNVPFGGVGNSGMGNYHGKFGFNAFSHSRGFVIRYNWLDVPIKYAPYLKKTDILKKFFSILKL